MQSEERSLSPVTILHNAIENIEKKKGTGLFLELHAGINTKTKR